jgi:hypothetical protein
VFHWASLIGTYAGVVPVVVAGGFGIPIMFPAPSYVGIAHAVPTEFVMPVISFAWLAVVPWTFMSESSLEDMADTKHARSTAIYSSANRTGPTTDMNVHPTFNSQVPLRVPRF